jgi:hypothetical protein
MQQDLIKQKERTPHEPAILLLLGLGCRLQSKYRYFSNAVTHKIDFIATCLEEFLCLRHKGGVVAPMETISAIIKTCKQSKRFNRKGDT